MNAPAAIPTTDRAIIQQAARLTTGFPRPCRSFYLDDMTVTGGDIVVCRSDLTGTAFTSGRSYIVNADGTLTDDHGVRVYPSARFTYGGAA